MNYTVQARLIPASAAELLHKLAEFYKLRQEEFAMNLPAKAIAQPRCFPGERKLQT
jgi:hypothetical protein